MEDDGCRVVGVEAGSDDVFEKMDVLVIVNAVVEGDVEGVVRARVEGVGGAGGARPTGSGEEFFGVVFVEGKSHDAVGRPEGLFDAIAMVDVDVDVEDAGVVE